MIPGYPLKITKLTSLHRQGPRQEEDGLLPVGCLLVGRGGQHHGLGSCRGGELGVEIAAHCRHQGGALRHL